MRPKRFCPFCGHRLPLPPATGIANPACRRCNTPVYENPVPATCLVVVDDREQLLLVKRKVAPKQGLWCLPGGYMALAESPEQAALRELFEETGLVGQIELLMGITSVFSETDHTIVMIGYLVKTFHGRLSPGDDAAETAFFARDCLPAIAFSSHYSFIRLYLAGYAAPDATQS
jgi:ADP-ribose pyrophosphatase YjhB (NUDIX family)